ncbi:RNA polymerase sigma factor [Gabonibacter chumensis]|uniref:RNA polymerase sigma factor n=1 Tax=Gabonibacter chumensis TaxID=2972474 RepID=UPI0025730C9A|nr:RNA polymerase sigma factor [Gabonibacter chumensis]MCR9013120.1 RNA polymerase sigma factor [Gabonibacter chumensis]
MEQIESLYIRRTLNGETAAFGQLVEQYSQRIFLLVLRIVRCREDAEELTQDVFLKAFRHLNTFKGDSSFSSWLYRIAFNTAISFVRKKKMRFVYSEEKFMDNLLDTDKEAEQNEEVDLMEKLGKIIPLLPPEEVALLTLYYTDNRNIEEIALILSQTTSNIKVKLFRIRKKLYTLLNSN